MFIKEIILDGFKSYSSRTEITDFDKHFNAITGLNGSGKSNILDAICFVLGISNLANVRVSSLQDLIYKSGTSGVVRASVSITFDNTDKSSSPIGYEAYEEITVTRQVAVGGKTKYLINGCNSQNTRVNDLFCSVQLNVNNPHFLIMQGKITKILNMKPLEILGMLEEAAGTRMYDSKKEQVLKLIEKKDAKLSEIDYMIHNDIEPAIAKLKDEKETYLELQSISLEIKHLQKVCTAFDYKQLKEAKENFQKDISEMTEKLDSVMNENVNNLAEIETLNVKLQEEMSNEKNSEEIKTAERALNIVIKKEAKAESDLNHAKSHLEKEQFRQQDLENQVKEIQSSIAEKLSLEETVTADLAVLKQEWEECNKNLKNAENAVEAMRAGLLIEEGEPISASELLIRVRDEENRVVTEYEQLKRRISHFKSELEKKRNSNARSEDRNLFIALDKSEQTLKKLKHDLDELKYNERDEQNFLDCRVDLLSKCDQLKQKQSRLVIDFIYRNPEHNFDRSRVLGEVARLFTVKDFEKFGTAIEVAAGNRLSNVVVKDVETAKLLLESGDLKRRVTFIPMNNIQCHSIVDDNHHKFAVDLVGKENVWPAISLLNFEPCLRKVMEFVFGSKFICTSLDVARKVAFHPNINKCTVTLEGDQFDPSGILTGGARQTSNSTLLRYQEWHEIEEMKKKSEAELADVNSKIDQERKKHEIFDRLRNEIMSEETKHASLKLRANHSEYGIIQRLRKELAESEESLKVAAEKVEACRKRVLETEEKMKQTCGANEREQAEKNLKEAKSRAWEKNEKFHAMEQQLAGIRLEIQDFQTELIQLRSQANSCETDVKYAKEKVLSLEADVKAICAESKQCNETLTRLKKENTLHAQKISEISAKIQDLERACNQNDLIKKQLELNLKGKEEEKATVDSRITELMKNNSWIESEESNFGKQNSPYDFALINIGDNRKRLKALKERHDKLARCVNVHAMQLLNEKVDRYNELVKKRKIVFEDKAKIQQTIAEWDDLKRETLNSAWATVNEDFGSIFSTLLPGARAKLSPPNMQSIIEGGLEIRVRFGDQWKESLAELSGGQRSLAALSLILALLRFKPAPLYIMDEIDAALDMSHTQNIGLMIKRFFRNSQFIIVSLKDGMFNNANVLFRTQFVDNMSTVVRYQISRRSTAVLA